MKTADQRYMKMKDKVTEDLKRVFRPEFLNRIDSQVVFHTLAKEHIRKIVDLQPARPRQGSCCSRASRWRSPKPRRTGSARRATTRSSAPARCAASIQNELEDRLSEALLQERFGLGDTVFIDIQGDDLIMEKKEPSRDRRSPR